MLRPLPPDGRVILVCGNRVDALGPIFSTPWRVATRSDVLRGLILDGLPTMEAKLKADHKPQKRGARP